MPSINRPLAGPMLTFDLKDEIDALYDEEAFGRSGKAGKTLAKSGRLRLVLIALGDEAGIATHQADSPLTIQVFEGAITFRMNGEESRLKKGEILFFGPGDAHDIRAHGKTALLLTLSAIGDDYEPDLHLLD